MSGTERFGPQGKKNEKAKDEVVDGDHFSKLYDQNEDAAGQKIDEATGHAIDNTPEVDGADEVLSILEASGEGSDDILGALPEENDAAAKWLRAQAQKNKEEREGGGFKKAA